MERIPVQLVVCDIDDTLIHKDDHLKEETIQVIQELKRRGIQFTLATGRMPYRAESYARDAELTIPYVANNGSILYDRGRMIWCRMLYAKIIQEITQRYMEMYPQFTVIFSFTDRECPLVRTEWIRKRLGKYKGRRSGIRRCTKSMFWTMRGPESSEHLPGSWNAVQMRSAFFSMESFP